MGRMGNDVDSDFEENSVNETNNTWPGPVEASLFEGRPVVNPVVDFSQVPAAIGLDRVVVGFAIYADNAAPGTAKYSLKSLVSSMESEIRSFKVTETRVGVFACQMRPLQGAVVV